MRGVLPTRFNERTYGYRALGSQLQSPDASDLLGALARAH